MGRHDESFQQDYERSIRLGESNLECIRGMQRWCEHIQIEPRASGLFAQMSGLPSGSHRLSCPYSDKVTESANLRWITSSFLIEACDGCPHHSPNGDDSWGAQILSEHKTVEQKRQTEEERRRAEITRVRNELRTKMEALGESVETESQRIVNFVEDMFSDDPETHANAVKTLTQAARVGADLFPIEAVELLIQLTVDEEYDSDSLAICTELTQRTDLTEKLKLATLRVMQEGRLAHKAAIIAARLGDAMEYPLPPKCIERLLLTQHHDIPIGGWTGSPPDYSGSTTVLARSYDADADSVFAPSKEYLRSEEEYPRKQAASALTLLHEQCPELVKDLFPDLMHALEQFEDHDMTHGNASGRIANVFQAAFRHDAAAVDSFLAESMDRVRPTVQEDIIRVYRDQFFNRDVDWRERRSREQTENVSEAEKIAIPRLLEWIKNDRFEPEIRQHAADALDTACDYATGEMVKHFDALLGYYALLCEQEEPPPASPSIILPGDSGADPMLTRMTEMNRRQHWGFFKNKVVDCLESLCKSRPHDVFDSVYACLTQSSSQLGEELRGTAVSLLGELGSHFDLQPLALPVLMRELMNYGSAWVRSKATDALVTMFYSSPPSNVVDVINVHLRDPKVVVHQAAVKAIDRRPSWFTLEQAYEAITGLAVHMRVYRGEPYQLKHICEATIALARRHPALRPAAISIVESVLPTGERYVDEDVVKELTSVVEPDSNLAPRIVVHIGRFLASYDRDRYNSYSYSDRDRMVRWLHDVPPNSVATVSDTMLELASELAARDFWESWQFASMFGMAGMYEHESEVLKAVHDSYPDEPRFYENRKTVRALADMAAANEQLRLGDGKKAADSFQRAWQGIFS